MAVTRDLDSTGALASPATATVSGTVGFTVFMILGINRSSAADAGVVSGALPAVTALLSMLLFGERPNWRRSAAVGLSVTGISLVNLPALLQDSSRSERLIGNLLVLVATICSSIFILLSKRLRRPLTPLAQSVVMTGMGLVAMLPVAFWELRTLELGDVSLSAWLAVGYYGLIPTVLGFVWWYRGLERVSGTEAGVCTAIMPLSSIGLSALVLHEPIGSHHLVGLALVMVAIATIALSERSKPDRRKL